MKARPIKSILVFSVISFGLIACLYAWICSDNLELAEHQRSIKFPDSTKVISSKTHIERAGSSGIDFIASYELESKEPEAVKKHIQIFCEVRTKNDAFGYKYEFVYIGDQLPNGVYKLKVNVAKYRAKSWWEFG